LGKHSAGSAALRLGSAPARTPGAAPSAVAAEATFTQVFAVGEFRALWLAQLLSVAGDQLARVAMTVLVYDRTRSALLTALTYALTYLPWIVGGLALSGLADRLPRRQVMIACDLARMVLVLLMAAVSLAGSAAALWTMVALLFFVTLLDSPFKSARSALMADILTGERYVLGTTLTQITFQAGTVLGFALGGLVVAALGTRTALVADAVTFAISALLLVLWVHKRPAAAGHGATGQKPSHWADMVAGVRLVFGDPTLRTLVLFGWLVSFYVVPMGLAAPYAARFHGVPLAVGTGLVFAALPFGTAVGTFVIGRVVSPPRRRRWMGPMAAGSCAVLMLCWAQPGALASLAIFALAGALASFQLPANAAFVAAVPAARRGQAFGLANGGMQVAQGLWFIAAGALAETVTPATAIAISGLIGAALATKLMIDWRRQESSARSQP
jgi:MFS family permease